MHNHLWTLPLVGALLGWVTNWLAVQMLLYPRKPINVLWWRIQGLIPSQRARLAESVANAVESRLLSSDDISRLLTDAKVKAAIGIAIRQRVAGALDARLGGVRSAVAMAVPGKHEWMSALPAHVAGYVTGSLPALLDSVSGDLAAAIDLKPLLVERMTAFSDEELEQIVMDVAGRELRGIERFGIVIGGVVGLAQWLLLAML